ncbi:MAG: N-acetyltransferase [Alphaproteobacteria bacterium]|nr:N-acetyltransferase [Alphaproteobacteria bacterium]
MTACWVAPVRLRGRFVALEPLVPAHRDELRTLVGEPQVFAHLSVDLGTPGALDRWVDQAEAAMAQGEQLVFVKRLIATGRLVGSTRYMNIAADHRRLEIGWTWLTPSVWGGPVNTEAKLLLLSHAFDVLGAYRVEFRTDSRNKRSQAAISALGATKDGVFQRHMVVKDSYVRDTVQFALVDLDWPAIRARLEARLAAKAP